MKDGVERIFSKINGPQLFLVAHCDCVCYIIRKGENYEQKR